jgi:MFS family permease
VVGDIFPKEKRGRILGLIGAVFGLAFLVGPIIAGILLNYFSWTSLFIINIPIVIILILASYRYLPHNRSESLGRFDWKGILTLGLLLGSFTYGLNNIDSANFMESLISLQVAPFLSAALLFLLLNLYIEKRAEQPVIKLVYLGNRQFVLAGFIAVATGILQSSFVFIPDFAVGVFDITASEASFMLIPLVVATAIGSPVFGRLIDAYGSRLMIVIALFLAGSGFFILHTVESSKFVFYLSGALVGLGLSVLSGSSLRYIMLNESAAEDRAVTQGMLTIFISLGQLTGAALIGVIIAIAIGEEGYRNVFLYQSILLCVVFILAFFLKSHAREQEVNQ